MYATMRQSDPLERMVGEMKSHMGLVKRLRGSENFAALGLLNYATRETNIEAAMPAYASQRNVSGDYALAGVTLPRSAARDPGLVNFIRAAERAYRSNK